MLEYKKYILTHKIYSEEQNYKLVIYIIYNIILIYKINFEIYGINFKYLSKIAIFC